MERGRVHWGYVEDNYVEPKNIYESRIVSAILQVISTEVKQVKNACQKAGGNGYRPHI
ncbi:unnamed protein product, partial [Anisakis simplex]|uniref:Transposase n=1 Tax=Anisakis simplex TaxID=6269 RepID=A0A0M3KE96_ANISI